MQGEARAQRMQRLRRAIAEKGTLHLKDAARLLNISEMTVRRDLAGTGFLLACARELPTIAELTALTGRERSGEVVSLAVNAAPMQLAQDIFAATQIMRVQAAALAVVVGVSGLSAALVLLAGRKAFIRAAEEKAAVSG